jgi:hypothetical protein
MRWRFLRFTRTDVDMRSNAMIAKIERGLGPSGCEIAPQAAKNAPRTTNERLGRPGKR